MMLRYFGDIYRDEKEGFWNDKDMDLECLAMAKKLVRELRKIDADFQADGGYESLLKEVADLKQKK